MKTTGTLYQIAWRGGAAPEGWPRVLCEMFMVGHLSIPPLAVREFPHTLGGGYTLSIQHVPYPMIPLKPEVLARVRRQRLERRLQAKVPLFAEQMAAQELARKPEYYAGITDAKIEAEKQAALEREWSRYLELTGRPGELVVYAQEPEECRSKAARLAEEMAAVREKYGVKPV